MSSLHTTPRPIQARSVRAGDQVACVAATDELIPTLGGITTAQAGAGVAWHTVAHARHLDSGSAIVTGGPVWPNLNRDATLVIREQITPPGGPAPVAALTGQARGNVVVRVALDWRDPRHYQAQPAPCRICTTATQHRDPNGVAACKSCVEGEIEGKLLAFAHVLMAGGTPVDVRALTQATAGVAA